MRVRKDNENFSGTKGKTKTIPVASLLGKGQQHLAAQVLAAAGNEVYPCHESSCVELLPSDSIYTGQIGGNRSGKTGSDISRFKVVVLIPYHTHTWLVLGSYSCLGTDGPTDGSMARPISFPGPI